MRILRRANNVDSAISIGTITVIGATWFLVTEFKLVDPTRLPSPTALADRFFFLVENGYRGTPLEGHLFASLQRALGGFTIGALIGIPLGLLIGFNRKVGAAFGPIFAFTRPIPPIAFIPMIVLYFGLGETGKIVLISWTSLNYVVLNASAGAETVSLSLSRAAGTLGLSRRQQMMTVVVPSALPYIMTGLKVAMALSWAVVVAAELVGAQEGLGYIAASAALVFRVEDVLLSVIMIGIVGLILERALAWTDARVVHWKGR
ncbi:MAG: ABC transporter permease subunit [Chloroflexi bacterium]|nr:ABC transporter permease subunit [Chloroflexota bacterium]